MMTKSGNKTQEEIDKLIAEHTAQLKALDSAINEERDRQSELLGKRLEAKRAARREKLQIPKEMETLSSDTILRINKWK